MGCGASVAEKDLTQKNSLSIKKFKPNKLINARSSRTRLDYSKQLKCLPIVGEMFSMQLKYCYVSQRGYYPDDLSKANQDSYVILENIAYNNNCHFFGVFDGHGEVGDLCSHYCADLVPDKFHSSIANNIKNINEIDLKQAYFNSFVQTHDSLSRSNINDSLSGTTGITVFVKGDKLIVANVGDSRAIIASDVDGKLTYSPLSSDQTPYRKDERERLKKLGARIMTMDQIEGNEPIHENWGTNLGEEIDEVGDPPRVWDYTLEKPGCAFTRSLGDGVAKTCGVSPEPEMLEWTLSPDDRFAVIASDGMFEFITSQNVVDMIAKFSDPVEAAKYVVSEAYRLWLTYDDRTDDITIIIIYFDEMEKIPQTMGDTPNQGIINRVKSKNMHNVLKSDTIYKESKPVRTIMSKAKRKEISENWDLDQKEQQFDFNALENTKSDEEISRISIMLQNNFMFEKLSPIQKENIYKVMKLREVKEGEVIIKEGDKGDEMYIVDNGEFNVLKEGEDGTDHFVFCYTHEGAAFGELSLMYGKPRAASVVAKSNGRLWCIGRAAFRAIIMKENRDGLLKIYRTIPLLNELSTTQLQRLCQCSKEVTYSKGDVVLNESTVNGVTSLKTDSGETKLNMNNEKLISNDGSNWVLCVVLSGVLRLIPKEEGKKRHLRSELTYLAMAEVGTKYKEVIADANVKLMCIPRDGYLDIVGMEGEDVIRSHVSSSEAKGRGLASIRSVYSTNDSKLVKRLKSLDQYTIEAPVILLGDFGYVVTATDTTNRRKCCIKIISKIKAFKSRMDKKIAQERHFLTALSDIAAKKKPHSEVGPSQESQEKRRGSTASSRGKKELESDSTSHHHHDSHHQHGHHGQHSPHQHGSHDRSSNRYDPSTHELYSYCLPFLEATYGGDRIICMIYGEHFVCDLFLALSTGSVTMDNAVHFIASIYSAVSALHENGLIHRFINPTGIYITNRGVPKITDFRYMKRMDGSRSYTICGDPLYFAPEIISQQGYDYSADLWAFGVLCYEIFEGIVPFGGPDAEETAIFQSILSHKKNDWKIIDNPMEDRTMGSTIFTAKTPTLARDLITRLLDPKSTGRLGYRNHLDIKNLSLFHGIKWDEVGIENNSTPLNIQSSIEASQIFNENELEIYNSAVFDDF